jgi:hypothetical protein
MWLMTNGKLPAYIIEETKKRITPNSATWAQKNVFLMKIFYARI